MNNSMPLVSVIVPTYGRANNLDRAIQSVLHQTFSNWELFVVDDNNSDSEHRIHTEKVMEKYCSDSRIHYIKHPRNMNGAAARNTGIELCRGEYISFLDDDDEYIDTRFEACINVLHNSEKIYAGVYTGCLFYKEGKVYRKKKNAKTGNYLVQTLATTFESHSGSNLFLKSRVVRELKGFDTSFFRHQDYEFLVRLFEKYDLIGIPKYLLVKHENWQNLPNISRMQIAKEMYLSKYGRIISGLSKKEQNYVFYSNYISLAILALEAGSEEYSRYFVAARKYKRLYWKDLLRISILKIRQCKK